MNFGRFSARGSMNSLRSFCPAFCPLGSVTFSAAFFPERSTMRPFDSSMRIFPGTADPSLVKFFGRHFSPPRAYVMASRTLVLPFLFFPPIMVSPFSEGAICTHFTRLTFSASKVTIFTDILFVLSYCD